MKKKTKPTKRRVRFSEAIAAIAKHTGKSKCLKWHITFKNIVSPNQFDVSGGFDNTLFLNPEVFELELTATFKRRKKTK